MLIQTIDGSSLKRMFEDYGRDYFTYTACDEIVRLFEETDGDQNTEVDIIGLCGDFNEETAETIVKNYEYIFEDEDIFVDTYDGNYDDRPLFQDIDVNKVLDILNEYTWAVATEDDYILFQAF